MLTRGIGGQPGSLDPQRAEDAFSNDVLRDLYEGLTASTPDGAVIPATATSWRVEEGGRRYVFQLRRDARWSNGDPVTAAQFVAGFRRAMDPKTVSGAADLLRAIENAPAILQGSMPPDRLGVRAIDDYTLEIRLSHAVPYFPDILTNTVASPVHPSSIAAEGGFSEPGKTISNGPYVLATFAPGANLVLKRNPHYWDSAAVTFDEVRYEFVPDENAEFTRFRAGELDITDNVPEQRFQELLAAPNSGLQHRSTLATFYFTFNTDRGPLRGRRGLREALSLALDRRAIAESVARAGQVPAYSLVPDDAWNYEPAYYSWRDDKAADRIAKARKLYAESGYSAARPLRIRHALQRKRAGREGLHRHRRDVEGGARRRDRACADGIQGISRGARGPSAVGRGPRRLDGRLQRRLDLSRHDDAGQPAELRALDQRATMRACSIPPRTNRTRRNGATRCSRRSR